jgi:hypothetical protein
MGHVRGVAQRLDALLAQPLVSPAEASAREVFVTLARALLTEFQLDALEQWWSEPPGPSDVSPSGETTHALG